MTTGKIEIEDKVYNIKVVENDEEAEKGLMGVEELPEDSGMLFPQEGEEEVAFWMKNTDIPLDIIFIDEDGNVTQVTQAEPNDETPIIGKAHKVLELNVNSGIKVGDQIFFLEDNEEGQEPVVNEMFILGPDGNPQATIEGGERIFSRKNTVTLIKMAKRAFRSRSTPDFKSLGKKAFAYLETQDSNTPEYVKLPD